MSTGQIKSDKPDVKKHQEQNRKDSSKQNNHMRKNSTTNKYSIGLTLKNISFFTKVGMN